MRLQFLTACAALLGIAIQTAPVQAGEAYVGGQVLGAISDHNFGGFNSVGFLTTTIQLMKRWLVLP